ncbi:glycosyltransferase family 2 protein [Paenibacillus jamilae]|uniref:glycosyltransferase family 2 protein n=1 Tax=Paenibacillus TaxID=44249 RepID=UPI0015F32CE0|nr:glycosyltransferase family 2 protein [Paenibacillus jamilae]
MKPTISLVMIVKNEANTLKRCLDSVVKYVDEIVIVDTGSTDDSKKIAESFHARIIDYTWKNDFAAARNFALEQSTGDWNFVLDADEYVSNDCMESLQNFITYHRNAIGKIKRIDKFAGTDGINYEQIYISRLFPSHCRFTGKIHEQVESDLPRIKLDIEIQHDGYFQQTKSDRNIPILKEVIAQQPDDPYYHFHIAKEYRGLEDHEQALIHLKQAYAQITGQEGYAPSVIVNLLYAMIASGHLEDGIQVIENCEEFLSNHADFYFVSALYLLELILSNPEEYSGLIPFIEQFYQRALEIGETGSEGSVVGTGSFAAHHNLGVFYEVIGDSIKASEQYLKAAGYEYEPSIKRLEKLNG